MARKYLILLDAKIAKKVYLSFFDSHSLNLKYH
jgi:hypothetical protein